jgi:hypothetical protein
MMRGCVALAFASFLVVPLSAGQQRDDFAKGFAVELDEVGPLFELEIPDEVYQTVTRQDLGDLRVFNRDGTIVPHVVRRPSARVAEGLWPRPLSFFPLRGQVEETAVGQTLRIITDDRGVIVGATTAGGSSPEQERVTAYIIDLSGLPDMPSSLDLDWKSTAGEGFAVTVSVESSEDLARWRTLATGVTLAELRSGGASLVHKKVALSEFESRYLRIAWPESLRGVHLTGVMAFFPARAQLLERKTLVVAGAATGDRPDGFEFDTGGMRPVDRVRVVFEEGNAVAEAAVFSRQEPEGEWRQRFTGWFYSLERIGALVRNEPVRVEPTTDRYWRLELVSGQPWTARPPSLEIAWVPDLLTVVAQGDGPFTVAFGSATVAPADRTTDGVLRDIGSDQRSALISSARASVVSTLGGESRLQPPPPPLPWKTWLLWGILIFGVVLLAWMVRQLVA